MRTIRFKGNLLIAAGLLLAVSLPAQQTKSGTVVQYNKNNNSETEQIETYKDGKRYKLEFVEDKLTLLAIDGVNIPKENWGEYKAFVTEIQEQLKRDRAQAAKDREQAAKDREQAKLDRIQAEKNRDLAAKERDQAKLDRIQAEKDRQQADKDRVQAEKDRLQADKDRVQAEKDRGQADKDKIQADKDREQAEKDREQAKLDRIQAEKDRGQAKLDRIQAEKDRAKAAEDRKLLAELTNELVSDKLIADAKDLRLLTLSSNEMTVNGQKQPESVAKKYQQKYSRFAGNNLTYASDGYSKQMSMSSNN